MKRGYTLVEFLIVLSVIGIAAALMFPVYKRARKNLISSSCSSNLKQVGLGMLQYTQDFNGLLPLASIPAASGAPYGWADALQPYVKSRALFYCKENDIARPEEPWKQDVSDYYMNRSLSGRNSNYIADPENVIHVGEGNDGHDLANSSYSRASVPPEWKSGRGSPLWRHGLDEPGAFYLFLDGHTKYLKGTRIDFGFQRATPASATK